MKRIQKAALICATAALAVSFAACGNDKGMVTGDGAPNPNTVRSEQVTAEGWAAAFDFSGMTNASFKMTTTSKEGSATESKTEIMKIDGSKVYTERTRTQSGVSKTYKYYYSYESGVNYEYTYNESSRTWSREEDGNTPYNYMNYIPNEITYLASPSAYAMLTYDSKQSAYVYSTGSGNVDSSITVAAQRSVSVKIKNGKVAVIQTTQTDGTASETAVYQLYAVGSTTVTLPRLGGSSGWGGGGSDDKPIVVPSSGSQVTQQEWDRIMTGTELTNATMTVDLSVAGMGSMGTTIVKVDAENRRFSVETKSDGNGIPTMQLVFAHVRGQYLRYQYMDNEWSVATISQEEFDSYLEMETGTTTNGLDYTLFTYDSKTASYVAKNITVPDSGVKVQSVTVTFKNKRLYRVQTVATQDGMTATADATYTDYGTTYVEIPDVATPDPGDDPSTEPSVGVPVDEYTWSRALSREAFYNCTMTSLQQGGAWSEILTEPTVNKFDYESGMFYYVAFAGSNTENVNKYSIIKVNTDTYVKVNDGDWALDNDFTLADMDVFSVFCELMEGFIPEYNNIQYDKLAGCHIAEKLYVAAFDVTFDEVRFYFSADGRLASLVIKVSENSTVTEIRVDFSDYGSTYIKVPNVKQ